MSDYRLYFLNAEGHIQLAMPLVCDTDQEAIDAVSSRPNAYGMELWQLERRVMVFDPRPSAEPDPWTGPRPTSLERAYHLARSGACPTVADIKLRLRAEGFDENQVFGPTLLADLRRLCAAARAAPLAESGPSPQQPQAAAHAENGTAPRGGYGVSGGGLLSPGPARP